MKRFKGIEKIIKNLYSDYGVISYLDFDKFLACYGAIAPYYQATFDGEKVERKYI